MQAKQSAPVSGKNPVTLSFEASGAGPLLVHVAGFEAELESRILDSHGRTVNVARLPYMRTCPVYQLLAGGEAGGRIEVQVSAIHQTKNATVTIRVYQLPTRGRVNRLAEQAYRLYSDSIQSTRSEAIDLWRERADGLQQAANLFRKAGLEEQALWSDYLAAYFTYFPVSEYQPAVESAQAIRLSAGEAGLQALELAAVQLQGQALIERDTADTPARAAAKLNEARHLFQRATELAERRGAAFEQAWAVNNLGLTYFYMDLPDEALEQYRRVLHTAIDLEDDFLTSLARGNIAMSNERQGNYEAALEALLAIRQDLERSGSPVEQAMNLADVGRLYSKLFLFPQAIDTLAEALEIARELDSAELNGRVGLSLAMAYNDMGHVQRAREILLTAIGELENARNGRGLRDAYRLLADIDRFQGEYRQAAIYRERQGRYLRSDREQAEFFFSRGLDALSMGEPARAMEMFSQAHALATEIGNEGLRVRSLLRKCALASTGKPQDACDSKQLEDSLHAWLPRAAPRFALDARFSWARLLERRGADAPALAVLEKLVSDIRLYRARLPGVLGAWYWESREAVFTAYLDLVLKGVKSQQQMLDALVTLDQLRNLENSKHGDAGSLNGAAADYKTEEIRTLLARLPASRDDNARLELGRAIDQRLLAIGSGMSQEPKPGRHLLAELASLPPDAAYLTYHFSGSDAWAWIATSQGVRLVRVAAAQSILTTLKKVRADFRVVGNADLDRHLDALGQLMLGPLDTTLPSTVYLASAGALAGFPFEAIRHNGRYLAQDHVIINVLSLDGLNDIAKFAWKAHAWDSVFLAGAPNGRGNGLAALAGAESEIEDIARMFEQKSVFKFTGEDFRRAIFSEPVFGEANLVHIASHGSINLEYPELSRLALSGGLNADGDDYLTPLDLHPVTIRAELVVLSACETTGVNAFSFDSNLGFVSAFLRAGANAVVATLWPVPDRHTRDFMLDFYAASLDGEEIPEALTSTKRRYMETAQPGVNRDWAAYQVYIE